MKIVYYNTGFYSIVSSLYTVKINFTTMSAPQKIANEVTFKLLLNDIRSVKVQTLIADMWAAIPVALISIPQAIAFSLVAGLPLICGILSTILGTSIAALLGSSKHLVVGPGNATTLLVQTAALEIISRYYAQVDESIKSTITFELMAALTLIIGILQILAALFRFSRVIQFVSYAVILGYLAGSATAITVDQLFNFFGIEPPAVAGSLYEKFQFFLLHINRIQPVALLVGIMSVFTLLILYRVRTIIPPVLVMVILVTIFVHMCRLDTITDHFGRTISLVRSTGHFDLSLPKIQVPLLEVRLLNGVLPIAFAIALIGMLDTTSIAKAIATRTGQRLSNSQEVFALGIANSVLAVFGALPCSGSSSRTILNYEGGAQSRFSAFFSGIFLAIIIWTIGSLVEYVPLSTLSALLLATSFKMVRIDQIKHCLKTTRYDAIVFLLTLISCIFFTLQIAFYIGITLSIFFYLRKAATPEVTEYCYQQATGELRPLNDLEKNIKRVIRIINVEGDLFFGAADLFQSTLQTLTEHDDTAEVLILRLKHVREMDATAALALKQLHEYLQKSERILLVSSIPKAVWSVFDRAGLVQLIGRENLFLLDDRMPQYCMMQAIERANQIVIKH